MKVLLLGDTHGWVDDSIVELAVGMELVVHTGDIGSASVLAALKSRCGNVLAVAATMFLRSGQMMTIVPYPNCRKVCRSIYRAVFLPSNTATGSGTPPITIAAYGKSILTPKRSLTVIPTSGE